MKLLKDFYIPGVKHVCRFCSTPIAKLVDGKLLPLGNKAHVSILLECGTIHRFNCCKSCAKRKDFSDSKLIQSIWEGDCETWKNLEVVDGADQEEATERMEKLKKSKIVKGFANVEIELEDANKSEKLAKAEFKKLIRKERKK